MFGFLPKPRSPYWFVLGAGLGILAVAVYLFFFEIVFGRDSSLLNIPGILTIFMLFSQLIVLGGYFNLRLYLILACTGYILGLSLFLNMLRNPPGGFEDLVGAISFLMLSCAGIAAGAVAELIRYLLSRLRKAD